MQINHYDAEGLRHEIEENGQLVQFIFSDREVVVEKTESDTLRLIRGYDITASESEQAKTYYHYASDEMGSTTHIFEGQDLRNRYEYDAFGNIVVSEEQVSNRFKYTGQQHDPITQQYYLRARFYNPVIARFTQEDPYRGAGLNLYAYCDNNPVSYFDPSGYSPCPTKQDLYKKYRAEGRTASEANFLANMDLVRANKGESAANNYAENYLKDNVGKQRKAEEARMNIRANDEIGKLPNRKNGKKAVNEINQIKNREGDKLGPAVAGALDLQTGTIRYGTNNIAGDPPKNLNNNIVDRVKDMPKNVKDSYKTTQGAGSHAEVNAVNDVLNARQDAKLSDVKVYVEATGYDAKRKMTPGEPMVRCPHCEYITDGVQYSPSDTWFGKDRGRGYGEF